MVPLPSNIIDSHVHFWHPDKILIPWQKGSIFESKPMDGMAYSQDVKRVRVQTAVYVETDVDPVHSLVEADWIARYAETLNNQIEAATAKGTETGVAFGGIGAIVAYAPVHQGKHVVAYLDLLTRLVGRRRLRGVRHLIQDPLLDPDRVRCPDFIDGVRSLASFGLSFDLNINCNHSPQQFPPIITLVQKCPDVRFVLDHMAKPPCDSKPGQDRFEFWRSQMLLLGKQPNVVCKVSGLVTETQTESWTVEQLGPFVETAKEAFGVDRILFGGDWPVCNMAVKWQTWIELLSIIIQDWPDQDKHKLFVTNAAKTYQLSSCKTVD
ncbi:hypothetical protein J3Q64DRAFT_1426860 [Phycomyces blakesleeanus]|uniref:Amidohydrolase-related domain-containing protein n=2 Tax=Phycomyces blakesleeanus TaxID=4837 RepID=A0A167RFF2_PHYB8|nr:hypothetical protein PHYBLDRAFT_184636 [Phycomyces blakesleeanus NRRL 1555(-)]OAD81527.1 hypothetical protein PHYBLDRAFT_184636 [Phycomyces blakesleeanus NRRL 1555(-)]|eukprot:XP_018299567.1 hypothetical protein PHYBLDRAFT_184636 [Phycomyces blakesleeanus NRRL 1555(-)]